jgi:hypothetical protein
MRRRVSLLDTRRPNCVHSGLRQESHFWVSASTRKLGSLKTYSILERLTTSFTVMHGSKHPLEPPGYDLSDMLPDHLEQLAFTDDLRDVECGPGLKDSSYPGLCEVTHHVVRAVS